MNNRTRLLAMSWGHLLNDGAALYLPGVLPVVLVSLGAPRTQAGVLMGALLIGQGLQPAIGFVSDHVGGRAITLGGMIAVTVAGGLIGLAPSYWSLVALLLVIGLANACYHPQALAGVRTLSGDRRGMATAVFLIGGELGRGVWPFFAGLIVAGLGLPWLWLVAVPTVLSLPLLLASFPKLPPRHRDAPPIHWRQHLGPFTRIVVFTALRIALILALVTFLPLWWTEQGGGVVGGSAMVMVLYVLGIFGNAAGGHFADRIGFRRVALLASAATVVLMVLLILVPGPARWVVVSLLGMSLFASLPVSIALGQDALPENPSLGAGIALGFCNAIGAVLVLVLGLFVDRVGVEGLLWITAGLSAVALFAAWPLPLHHGEHEAADTIGEQTTDAALVFAGPAEATGESEGKAGGSAGGEDVERL